MSTKMTRAEAETFLAGVRVGVLSVEEPGRGPLSVPIWYGYEAGGDVWFVTERDSRKGKLLAEGKRVSLCAQNEVPPYQYVSVEGPIRSIAAADVEEHVRPLAHRYLGAEGGDQYVESTEATRTGADLLVRVSPERWLSVDYGKESIEP